MADVGHEETEKLLRKLEKELAEEYKKARYEILEKYAEHCNRFAKREAEMAELVRQGLVTEEAFNEWKMKEIPVNARWNEMCDTIARDCTMTNQMAKSIAYGYMPEIYAINYNYGTYQVESVCGIDTGFPYLYDRSTVERLFRGGEFIHAPGQRITDKINMKKDLAWNKKQVRSVLFQGIVQGESIPKMVKRLRKTVGDSITEDDIKNKNLKDAKQIAREVERRNRNAAIRNVRTMATGVQNAGRVDSYKRAQGMGIDLQQEWLATLDGRTRHQHRLLDGQRVDVGEKFKVDGDEIEYPGDPSAKGYLVYNCRCTLVPALKGFGVDANNLSLRNTDHMEEETYEQWKYRHQHDIMEKYKDKAAVLKEYNEWQKKTVINPITIECEKAGITKLGVKKLEKALTEEGIIKKVGGGDLTKGSCMSAALAYASNKNGYDVLDFRGEPSRSLFAKRATARQLCDIPGVKSYKDHGKNDVAVAKRLLKNMEAGKEYILITGQHAAIVRSYDGTMKYAEWLELQDSKDNGYRFFSSDIEEDLRNRFGCRKYGTKRWMSYLIDIDSIKDNDNIRAAMEYINTEPGKQKKGKHGKIK